MSVYNLEQVKYLEKLGVKRVVLARELTLEEIENICSGACLETEIFVHGALCVSYSGQCLLSSVIGGRSANRGSCAQPCRMKYSLYNSNNETVVSNKYVLSKKDIYGLPYIEKLKQIGVTSFKLEGRNKTPEYVANVTRTYRKYIDSRNNQLAVNKEDEYTLKQIFNRDGLSSGYFKGPLYKNSITKLPKNTGIYLGKILSSFDKFVKIKLEENIDIHDGIEIIENDYIKASTIVTCIMNENKKIINNSVKKGNIVYIGDIKGKVNIGSSVYKTSSKSLNNKSKSYYDGSIVIRKDIDIIVYLNKNEELSVKTVGLHKNIETSLSYKIQKALNKPTTNENITIAFSKTLDTNIRFNVINIDIPNDVFIPASKLNELRRTFVFKVFDTICNTNKLCDITNVSLEKELLIPELKENKVLGETLYVYKYDSNIDYIKLYNKKYGKKLNNIIFNISDIYVKKDEIFSKYLSKVDIFISLPNVCSEKLNSYIYNNLEDLVKHGVKGIVIESIGYIGIALRLKRDYNLTIIAGYSLNILNKYSASFYTSLGFDFVSILPEINPENIEGIKKYSNVILNVDNITVMTSRYCVLGAFVSNRDTKKCNMPCIKDKYYLLDSYNKKYNIVCDNNGCIMRIVTSLPENNKLNKNINLIYSIL